LTARRRLSAGLVALAAVLTLAAAVAWYGRVALLDSGGFADRAAASVKDASVRTLIADRLTDQVILRHQADLVTARPLISSAVAGIVGGGAFGSLLRRAVLDAHRAFVGRSANTLTLTVADVGTVAAQALEKLKPGLAARVDESGRTALRAAAAATSASMHGR
jgi:hypothetical protein